MLSDCKNLEYRYQGQHVWPLQRSATAGRLVVAGSNPGKPKKNMRRRASRRLAVQMTERVAIGVVSWTFCWTHCMKEKKTTRHTTRPSGVPMVERDVEGGSGGDLANGPLDGHVHHTPPPPVICPRNRVIGGHDALFGVPICVF